MTEQEIQPSSSADSGPEQEVKSRVVIESQLHERIDLETIRLMIGDDRIDVRSLLNQIATGLRNNGWVES